MKKFTSILAVATVVVALASCGSKPAETAETMVDSTATEMEAVVETVDSAAVAVVDTAAAAVAGAADAAAH